MSYLSGTNIYLRAIEPEDLDILYQWENDSSLWVHGCTLAPFSKFTLREYIQNSCYDIYQTRQLRMMITLKKTNETIGMVDLFEIDPHHERGAVGMTYFLQFKDNGDVFCRNRGVPEYAGMPILKKFFGWLPVSNDG